MLLPIAVAVLSSSTLPGIARIPPDTVPGIVQVDHILARVSDSGPLFSFLSDTLNLPVAWEIARFGSFTSGGVSVGNLNIEVFEGNPGDVRPGDARFSGIAFQPRDLSATAAKFESRGIPVGRPTSAGPYRLLPFDSVAFTMMGLPSLTTAELLVFFSEYSVIDLEAYRAELATELLRRRGGTLGVLRAEELMVGAGGDRDYWNSWLSVGASKTELQMATLSWEAGPRVVIDFVAPKGLQTLVLRVRSLEDAARYLDATGLLGEQDGHTIRIKRSRAYGLDIRLIEVAEPKWSASLPNEALKLSRRFAPRSLTPARYPPNRVTSEEKIK